MDRDNEIELVQTIQEKDKIIEQWKDICKDLVRKTKLDIKKYIKEFDDSINFAKENNKNHIQDKIIEYLENYKSLLKEIMQEEK